MITNNKGSRSPIRCVIYTRKSSEEGLEQEFNSLDAQREACEAYIKSQAHEGWVLINTRYDDGGFSGGNMNRPALVQLMEDIQSREIDIILVYKVDRLSRSLADFSKMVETFDEHDVSFVSITQHFNTSTSMGRLTLNVLLSFAQFEREVTGERIRDKFAASKKKGMWMGGHVPLGYDNIDRSLVINSTEAETVRHIYQRYLDLESVKLLKEELDREGVRSKRGKNGAGGNPFSRGALYALLQNPLYIGKIRHKEKVYDGNHKPIINKSQWKSVQETLKRNRRATYLRTNAKEPSLLAGLVFDKDNRPLSPTHTRKKNRRYRYYVNQAVLQFKQIPPNTVTRVPAQQLESLVIKDLTNLLKDSVRLLAALSTIKLSATEQKALKDKATNLSEYWARLEVNQQITHLTNIVKKISLTRSSMTIVYSLSGIANDLLEHADYQGDETFQTETALELKRCGVETKLVVEQTASQKNLKPHADSVRAIQDALKKGLIWNQALVSGEVRSAKELAEKDRYDPRYISQLMRLAYLSPNIISRIFKGDIPHDCTLKKLKKGFPLEWAEQETLFS